MMERQCGSGTPAASTETQPGFSRRNFLRVSAWAAASAPFLSSCSTIPAPAPKRSFGANEKLQHACIGVGGMGWVDLNSFIKHPRLQIVALCDVDSNHLDKAAETVPGARLYSDWRELLEKEQNNIDSMNLAVPDHMHFPIAYTAIQNGKHVYCQKPMCHDVAEVRALTRAAGRSGAVTQLGTQAASTQNERAAVEWLRKGVIGKVTHAYLCSNRPGAETYRPAGPRPEAGVTPPPHLNWDLWIGTAPMRPYAPDIYHPTRWRAWQDFGTGWSGDIGCHIFDPVWKGLGLRPALSVQAEVQESWLKSPTRRTDNWPQGQHITWTLPGNDMVAGNELVLEWFDGEFYPPEHIRKLYSNDLKDYPTESSIIIGTEGALLIGHGQPPILLPEDKFQSQKLELPPPRDHYLHFVDACLGKAQTECHFSQTGPMTETILLGTVAIRMPGEKLAWDHKRLQFTNNSRANKLLRRTYREKWHTGPF